MDLFGKKKAQDLRAHAWEFEEFEHFFADEGKSLGIRLCLRMCRRPSENLPH